MRATTTDFLSFARPSITDRERAAVLAVLDSGWLTTGPRTKAFEAAFAELTGAPSPWPSTPPRRPSTWRPKRSAWARATR